MNEKIVHEILHELFSSLETLDTQSTAILQFLKDKGIGSEEDLAPYLEQAGDASSLTLCNQLPAGSVTFANNVATHGYPQYAALPASWYGAGLTQYAASFGDPCEIKAWTNGIKSILTF